MKVTVFTSNQPRHCSLISDLAAVADQVIVVQESTTIFPGRVEDFYHKSAVMQEYFSHVISAEKEVFGAVRFTPSNARTLVLKIGDLNLMDLKVLAPALEADLFVVFGASFIKPPLIDRLVAKRAINIHMGVSPYYRGNSCNFWALYDGNPDLVGATIHLLSRGLDSGGILFHALPKPVPTDPFVLGMKAVRSAQRALVKSLVSEEIFSLQPEAQDRGLEIRYTRNQDFNDVVAEEYLARRLDAEAIGARLASAPKRHLLRPRYEE